MSRPTRQATPAKPMSRPEDAPGVEPVVADHGEDHRRDQRHHGQQQAGRRTVQLGLRVPEQQPRAADLDERVDQQHLPSPEHRNQRPPVQGDRQQQQRRRSGCGRTRRPPDRRRVHGDLDQQVRHAPDQAHRAEQHPPASRHRSPSTPHRVHSSTDRGALRGPSPRARPGKLSPAHRQPLPRDCGRGAYSRESFCPGSSSRAERSRRSAVAAPIPRAGRRSPSGGADRLLAARPVAGRMQARRRFASLTGPDEKRGRGRVSCWKC